MNEKLKREIGVIGLASNMVNIIIGAGIFILPPLVASYLGEASILAYLFCGLLMLSIVFCFAEIGSNINRSGGLPEYIRTAFGDYAGFLANILMWFGTGVMMNAAIANAMAGMLKINDLSYKTLLFLLIFGGFAFINIRGVKYGNRFVILNTTLKLIPLFLLIIFGWISVSTENLVWQSTPTFKSIGEASLMLFFAFAGGEAALNASGEIKNPQKTIPKGVFLGLFLVLVVYILIQVISQGILGKALITYEDNALSVASEKVFGEFGTWLVFLGGIISIFGSLSGSVLSYPRVIFAGAERGWFPSFLKKIHPKFHTPFWAIILFAVLDFGFAVSGEFKYLAIISSASILLIYFGVACAVIKIRFSASKNTGFKSPLGLTFPIISIISILWFLSNLKEKEFSAIGICLVILSVIYLIINTLRREK